MKILSEKISRRRGGPFRGITHLECSSLQADSMRLRGHPVSIEIVANNDEGRRFTIRLDALETARLADLFKPLVAPVPAPGAAGATNDG